MKGDVYMLTVSGVIQDAKFKRREALEDLAKAASQELDCWKHLRTGRAKSTISMHDDFQQGRKCTAHSGTDETYFNE
jgi:hypothetical protein